MSDCPILANSSLTGSTLSGRIFDDGNLIELHCRRVTDDILLMAGSLGYSDAPLIGTARELIRIWRYFGVRYWSSETIDYLVRGLLVRNRELASEEKDSGFFLVVCAACLFCVNRTLAHARRGNVDTAEMWLTGAQQLRYMRLSTPFSVQKQMAKAGADAKDVLTGQQAKRQEIREIWASGKYSARDICAEQEFAALGMSFSTARKALRGTPDPT